MKKQPVSILDVKARLREKNIDLLRQGHTLAKTIFETSFPTSEMAIGMATLLDAEIPESEIPGIIDRAKTMAHRYNLLEMSDLFDFVNVILHLEDGEDAERIAKEVFSTSSPSVRMIFGILELLNLDPPLPIEIIPSYLDTAGKIAALHGSKDIDDLFTLTEILTSENDEKSETHLYEASKVAKEIFGDKASVEDLVAVYWQVYGEEDGE